LGWGIWVNEVKGSPERPKKKLRKHRNGEFNDISIADENK
jgi:hypothetical protein